MADQPYVEMAWTCPKCGYRHSMTDRGYSAVRSRLDDFRDSHRCGERLSKVREQILVEASYMPDELEAEILAAKKRIRAKGWTCDVIVLNRYRAAYDLWLDNRKVEFQVEFDDGLLDITNAIEILESVK